MNAKTNAIKELQEVGRYLMDYELAWGNAGNISVRTAPDRYMISASGTYLGELADDDLVEVYLGGKPVDSAGKKPSKEMPMHEAIYQSRPEINAVLHASPFHSTMMACSAELPPKDLFVETMYYLERIARVPYCHPGSKELGEAVREQASKANILFLDNHGVLVYDTSVKEARMALQTLEMACRMTIAARSAGIPLKPLSAETVQDFIANSGYKPVRKWPL